MSNTDQPADGQLTRRQLREIRMTGATAIVSPEAAADAAAQSRAAAEAAENAQETPKQTIDPHWDRATEFATNPTPIPRAAEPINDKSEPTADQDVDLDSPAQTRRQAREQERIRTATIPVATHSGDAEEPVSVWAPTPADSTSDAESAGAASATDAVDATDEGDIIVGDDADDEAEAQESAGWAPAPVSAATQTWAPPADFAGSDNEKSDKTDANSSAVPGASFGAAAVVDVEDADIELPSSRTAFSHERSADNAGPVLRSNFGAEVLGGSQPSSFDDLLDRSSVSSGVSGSASALILAEEDTLPPLTSPVNSTGQIMLTGSFALPDGLGSQGHAPGIADGKDVDAVLIDGELPAQSSPTPIAATAAVSQAKTPVEMIRPPAPEKSNKLVIVLAITAGILTLAAIGVTVYLVSTGKLG